MESIDKLTLELLTNKTHYKRFLEKEHPHKYKEHQEYLEKIRNYKSKILNLSKEFLENPEKSFNSEVDEIFKIFSKTIIRYIELKEIERENLYHKNENNDKEDILFDSDYMNEEESGDEGNGKDDDTISSKSSEDILNHFSLEEHLPRITSKKINSFWGENIKKMGI
jgi:arginine deiminase